MEDRLLLWRFRFGSADALRRIYEKYSRDMFTLAAALVRDKAGAEDIVHDVFVSFAQSSQSAPGISNLKAYLMTAAANRARDMLRTGSGWHGQKRSVAMMSPENLADVDAAVASDNLTALIKDEELQQLTSALAQLPYEQQEAILLHERNGLTFKAIAAHQEVSINTVQSRYRYGLDKLRSIMKSGGTAL
jgi:RNA polymerase sigma-70 factor, ECF subfamily